MVLVHNGHFSNVLFLGNIGQENVFYDILEQKNCILGYKNKKLKSRKITIFPKGLTHGFDPKMEIFPTFLFQAIQARKMSFTIFQNRETAFQAIKTTGPQIRKISVFLRGLSHGFGPKIAIFPSFFFRQYRPRICLLRYSRTKKRLSRL